MHDCSAVTRSRSGSTPSSRSSTSPIAGSLRDEAVRAALRRLLAARDPDLIDLGTDYGLHQVRETLGRLTASRGAVDLEEWSRLSPEAIVAHWRGLVADRLWPAVRDRAGPSVRRCLQTIASLDSDHAKIRERRAALPEALAVLVPGAAPCSAPQLDALVELLKVIDLPRKAAWPSDDDLRGGQAGVLRAPRSGQEITIKPALEWDEPSVLGAAEQSLRFARLALTVRREHEQLKRRRRGLDFDDLMVMARDLLRNHPEVVTPDANVPGATTIEFVLVDEFQDTDAIQAEILRLLSGSAFLSGRLFVVGDVKQSIYRFRGAEPSIFAQWRAEFLERGRLRLTENFRSVPGVIHFVNALFGDGFGDVESGDNVGSPGGHRLVPIRSEDIGIPTVEFLWPAAARGRIGSKAVDPRAASDRGPVPGSSAAGAARRGLAYPRANHQPDPAGSPGRHRAICSAP